jgi:hypothetical protein
LAAFYEAQNDHIAGLLKPLSAHTADGEQDVKDMALKVKLAVNISFFANCCLAVLQLYAATTSGSLSLFATCADSGELIKSGTRSQLTCSLSVKPESVSGAVLIISRPVGKRYSLARSSSIESGRREKVASQWLQIPD